MKYTWGDQVLVRDKQRDASSGIYAVVVSLTPIDNAVLSERHNASIGSMFYTVEFSDGSDALVSEDQLEPYVPEQKEMGTKFTWGDSVKLKKTDESGSVSHVHAEVVGITIVETEQQSKHFGVPIGHVFYTVEFSNGSSQFVSEDMLEPDPYV